MLKHRWKSAGKVYNTSQTVPYYIWVDTRVTTISKSTDRSHFFTENSVVSTAKRLSRWSTTHSSVKIKIFY